MNNKFIVTGADQEEIVVSSDKGDLKVFPNNNLRKILKLKNNIEILNGECEKLENEYEELKEERSKISAESKQKTKGMIILGGIGILIFSAITSFSGFSLVFSSAIALGVSIDIFAIQKTAKEELKTIKSHLEVTALNQRLAREKRYSATEELALLLASKEKFKEEFTLNKEYTVDNNYDYVFTKAEYVEPEKNFSLARIKRVCRETLDKKRR